MKRENTNIRGKYYYEVSIVEDGLCRLGWSTKESALKIGKSEEGERVCAGNEESALSVHCHLSQQERTMNRGASVERERRVTLIDSTIMVKVSQKEMSLDACSTWIMEP